MSVAVLFSAFVVDVGNWFEHKRHLQVQADAAAFAAAGAFNFPCTPNVEKGIYQTAGQYGGATTILAPVKKSESSSTPLYNTQIGSTSQANIHELINSKTYFGQSSEDNTVEKAPCDPEAAMIDVKMTETNLPWFFKLLNVPRINAHARVSIIKQQYATAVLPIIESEPVEARVLYVNDETCLNNSTKKYDPCADGTRSNYEQETLATGPLTNVGSNEEKGTIKWSSKSAPVAVTIAKVKHIGVRIAVAGKVGALTGSGNETAAVCTHLYVECFDEDSGVVPPLLNISGYSTETKGTIAPWAPVAHKVTLSTPSPNTCSNGYFSLGNETEAECTLTITAALDYGSASTTGMTVTPEFVYTPGFTGETKKVLGTPLKFENGVWTGIGKIPSRYESNYGSTEINLVVKCKREASAPCEKSSKAEDSATLKDVQRVFSAGPDGSNRVVSVQVFEPGAANPVPGERDANAFEVCEAANGQSCTHNLAVTVELKGSLENATKFFDKQGKPIAPFHILQADNDQDGDDQFVVSCPPTTNSTGIATLYEESLAHGCAGKYGVNTHGGSCTAEKATQDKIEAEEKAHKEASEQEQAAKTAREAKEAEERAKWTAEEKETKITKAQREAKEKEAETKALWERQEGKGEITKAQREAKEKTKAQLEKEEKEGKITKAQREAKEKEPETKALWERRESKGELTKAQREAKEKTKAQLEKEEKEFKITKAQREEKEAAQRVARENAEKAEAASKTKREQEEQSTKEARDALGGTARECVGLVEASGGSSGFKSGQAGITELTAAFQNYFTKRIEAPVNGLHYYCPHRWINNNEGGVPIIAPNDSRLVQLFVVPFTVTNFSRKGDVSPLVPIENFATFYVTGWGSSQAQHRDGCSEKLFAKLPKAEREELEKLPQAGREAREKEKGFDDNADQPREVIGHLIKYVNVLNEAPGTVACKLEGLETCEAVLTE
jgi:hypothetical protein